MIYIVLGTRSEVIKLSSIIKELKRRKISFKIIHSGQHDTLKLMRTLKLPKPDYYFGTSLREKWSKKGKIIATTLAFYWGIKTFFKLRKIFQNEKPDIVIYNGNTMIVPLTVFAVKSVLSKKIILVHREAGLRWTETGFALNDLFRRIGECGDILFAPTKSAEKKLKELYKNKLIIFSGDPQVEIVEETLKLYSNKKEEKDYLLVNTVRSLTTKEKAIDFVYILLNSPFRVIYIINPHMKNKLKEYKILDKLEKSSNIKLNDPVDYPIFLGLIKNASVVMTDSHGVEEECSVLKVPCIVLNEFIQSPELVEYGPVVQTGIDKEKVIKLLKNVKNKGEFYEKSKTCKYFFVNKKATKIIVDILEKQLKKDLNTIYKK